MSSKLFEKHLAQVPTTKNSEEIAEKCASMKDALKRLETAVIPEDVPRISELIDDFDNFSPKVSLIGQVKAGKTALANALLGVSDLLPSDVNPWTSVVTSLHINCVAPKGKNAIFRFFENQDWDNLVSDSGHIIQTAKKAQLDSRLDELVEQIESLRNRTKERLGKNFELLLGNNHSFSSFNADLLKRYVCLGEEDEVESSEGRFADMTKSADLYMENEFFNYPITLSDTPGVNDPFLIREAATIQNLGSADVCIVVLSAHQALSSVDLGLIRLLKSLHSSRIIVFVNRIDELPDPQQQINEIHDYVTEILIKQNLSEDIPIIFGSSLWADVAISGNFDDCPEEALESLKLLIKEREATLEADSCDTMNIENLRDVSGVSALRDAITAKVKTEVFLPKIADEANRARVMAQRSLVYLSDTEQDEGDSINRAEIQDVLAKLDGDRAAFQKDIGKHRDSARSSVKMGLAGAYMHFNQTEKKSLMACLNSSGKIADWNPEIEGLRSELNAVYNSYSTETVLFFNGLRTRIAEELTRCYERVTGSADSVVISPPAISKPPVPIALMRTKSIDLRASSSLEWLRRKFDKAKYYDQLDTIIAEDLRETVRETCDDTIDGYINAVGSNLLGFLDEHRKTIERLQQPNSELIADIFKENQSNKSDLLERIAALNAANDILDRLIGDQHDDDPSTIVAAGE